MKVLATRLACLIVAGSLAAPALAQPAPVAIVSEFEGKGEVVDGRSRAALELLSELRAGQSIRLERGARAVVAFVPAGEVYELAGAGRFTIRGKTVDSSDAKNAPKKRPLPAPLKRLDVKAERVSQAAVVMRAAGLAEALVPLRPSATVGRVEELAFEWRPIDASLYRFVLVDEAGTRLHEADVKEARYALPASVGLQEGRPYVWAVSARTSAGKSVEGFAEFTILPAGQRAALEAARPSADAPVSDRVIYGLALEQRGLKEDAQRYWKELGVPRRR